MWGPKNLFCETQRAKERFITGNQVGDYSSTVLRTTYGPRLRMMDQTVGDTDLLCGHFSWRALVMKEEAVYDLIQIRFIRPIGVIF